MAGKRRVFGAAFKAKVALAAAKGDQTTAQMASQFRVRTSQVTAWKKQLMAQVAELFADSQPPHPRLHRLGYYLNLSGRSMPGFARKARAASSESVVRPSR